MVTQDKEERKNLPITTGVLDYFPDALLEVARCSKVGNDQHNAGEPLHWAKEKSTDEPDALVRHLLERGTVDSDGVRHSAKVAWRALAMLQRELDAERDAAPKRIIDVVNEALIAGKAVVHGPEYDDAHYSWQCKPGWPCWQHDQMKALELGDDHTSDQIAATFFVDEETQPPLSTTKHDPDEITGVPA